ncbi:TonB-dependent receptor plug domain-containing protein [Roseateles sp. BYS180W]|uniref:TonB-dependent receptor plug domain-containing protein n=1 Tax=Roseateles rivi TaxID=3299028 RepID=A0ABW7FX94_9BURK
MTSSLTPSRGTALAAPAQATALTAALLALISAAPAALAAPAPSTKLDTVQITATRSALKLDQVLADVTVLERADIERLGFGSLADLLRGQACFEFARNGNPGATTSLFLRGANSQHTALLIDGVRVDTQSGSGGASWQAIPLAQIERVEIVRGAASAIYGSDAVAGVVQVFTRQGDEQRLSFGAALGSLGRVKGDMSASGRLGALDYSLGLATEVAEGFNTRKVADPNYQADLDGWRQNSLNARLGWQLDRRHRVELLSTASFNSADYDASAKPAPGVDDRSLQQLRASRLLWSAQWQNGWQTELSLGEGRDRYETQTNARRTYLTESRVRNAALHGSLRLGPGQLNVLAEHRQDELINSGLLQRDAAQRSQNALGLGYLLQLGALDAQAHVRQDRDSEFGNVRTGTLAAGWRLSPQWRAWASAGTAFRAPTPYQLFSEYGPKPGAPALDAEHGRNRELGLNWNAAQASLSLTVYRNHVRDMIVWDGSFASNCVSTWGGCYGNLAAVRLQGVSLSGQWQLGSVKLEGSVDRQDARDTSTQLWLGRRAKLHGAVRLSQQLGALSWGAQLLASDRRFDRNDNKTQLGGYGLLNLDLGYQVNPALRLQVNLDNALNKVYETAGGYAQAPRTLQLGLRYTPR